MGFVQSFTDRIAYGDVRKELLSFPAGDPTLRVLITGYEPSICKIAFEYTSFGAGATSGSFGVGYGRQWLVARPGSEDLRKLRILFSKALQRERGLTPVQPRHILERAGDWFDGLKLGSDRTKIGSVGGMAWALSVLVLGHETRPPTPDVDLDRAFASYDARARIVLRLRFGPSVGYANLTDEQAESVNQALARAEDLVSSL